jgi:hypothetical protein
VSNEKNQNGHSRQTFVHQSVSATQPSIPGTGLSVSGRSGIGVQLNEYLMRFLANQPVRPAVSGGMNNPRSSVMIKPAVKTLSFAFLAFAAVSASAIEGGAKPHAAAAIAALTATCAAEVEIERGWEAQQRLLDERLAAKGVGIEIPGTIISPPLPDFGASPTRIAKPAPSEAPPVGRF